MHKFHEVGCHNMIQIFYNRGEIIVAWILVMLNIFQLLLLILALYLICIIFIEKRQRSDSILNLRMKLKDNDDRVYMTSACL